MVPIASGGFSLVDPEDAERVLRHNWSSDIYGYARAWVDGGIISMHRFVMGDPPQAGMQVDHINHDVADNRRGNLRWADMRQQQANSRRSNSTGYRGVVRANRKWAAQIGNGGRQRCIGVFPTPEDAARAYDAAAVAAYGEFAQLNFPEDHAAT